MWQDHMIFTPLLKRIKLLERWDKLGVIQEASIPYSFKYNHKNVKDIVWCKKRPALQKINCKQFVRECDGYLQVEIKIETF